MSPVGKQPREKVARALVRAYGFRLWREGRKHTIFVKDGVPEPIVLPRHRTISPGVLRTISKTLGVTVHELLEVLRNC